MHFCQNIGYKWQAKQNLQGVMNSEERVNIIHQGRVSSALRSGEGFVAKGTILEAQEIRKNIGGQRKNLSVREVFLGSGKNVTS